MRKSKKKIVKSLGLLALTAVLLLGLLAGCGGKNGDSLIIYDGNFSEMKIIHRMVKLLVEEKTDLKVTIKDEMSPVNAFNEMVRGGGDLSNSYDGTLLTTFLKLDMTDVPEGESLYDFVNRTALEKHGVYLLDKLGTNNTYAVAAPREIVDRYGLKTVSDLVPVAGELIFGAEHEFFSEEGSMKFYPFAAFYGLDFKEAKPVDIGLKYSAIESGNLDVTVTYATDGLNKKAGLVILEDDRSYFPEYNGALLVRADIFERFADKAPNLKEVLNLLGGSMTDADMVDMTYAVDVDGKSAEQVAKEFLQAKGLLNS